MDSGLSGIIKGNNRYGNRGEGGGRVGHSGAPAAIANAVVDALWHLGVRNIEIPMTPPKVW